MMDRRTYEMMQEAQAAGYKLVEMTEWIVSKHRIAAQEAEIARLQAALAALEAQPPADPIASFVPPLSEWPDDAVAWCVDIGRYTKHRFVARWLVATWSDDRGWEINYGDNYPVDLPGDITLETTLRLRAAAHKGDY